MNRTYELIYVLAPDATEQDVADLHAQVEQIVARMQGTLTRTDTWGRRKLAYEIGRHKEGIYVLEVIEGTGDLVKEIDRRLKNMDNLLRHLIVRVDADQAKAERHRTRRTEESRRRRVARGLPPDRQPGEGPQRDDADEQASDFDGIETEA